MSIKSIKVEDTTWPVDIGTDDEVSAEWVLRYGTTERREAQRLSVASVLGAYEYLVDPNRSMKDATASLRRARKASKQVFDSLIAPESAGREMEEE